MGESKPGLTDVVKRIHAHLVIQVSELGDFEGQSRGARERDESGMVLAVCAHRKLSVADEVLQGLRHQRPVHGMKMVRYRRRKPTENVVGRGKKVHVTRGIAQVPREAIQARIQMAGGAGGLTQTGSFVSVIKMFS